jgi:squalene-hopene/tetraprenyl-beta-curcumene cyclase
VKNVEASCWCFFFNNDHQPDVDDTGEVLLALKAWTTRASATSMR